MNRIVIALLALALFAGCGGKKQKATPSSKRTDQPLPADHTEGPAVYHASLGEVHLRYGFGEKAAAAFRRAYAEEKDPEEKAKYRFQLGRAYRESGNLEQALREMEEAINSSNSTDRKCDMYLELAKTCVLQEQWAQAERAYEFVANNSKHDWQRKSARTELSPIHAKTGKINNVVASLEAAIEQNPQDNEARLRLAEIFTTAEPNPQRAIELYEAIQAEGNLSLSLMERLASLYLQAGRLSRARRVYERLIQTGGNQKKNRYRLALAQVYEQAEEFKRAEELYRVIAEQSPIAWEKKLAKKRLYALYGRDGSLGRMIEHLEKQATEKPGDVEALAQLSEIYAGIGNDPGRAIAVTERLLILEPGDSTVLQRLADLYERTGQKEKAIEVLTSLFSVLRNGDRPACIERIGRLYTEMGNRDEALNWIAKLAASDTNSPGIHARAALLYLKNSRIGECLAEHEKALALCAGAEQRDALRAQLAEQLFEVKDYARAEAIYERLAESSISGPLKALARQKLAALHGIQQNGN